MTITVILFLVIAFGSCKRGTEEVGTNNNLEKSEFNQIVDIFRGFEAIIDENKKDPDVGVKKSAEYTKNGVAKIKLLEEGIKKSKYNSTFMSELKETNNKIKEISENVTKIAKDNYGVQSTDILIQLSDLALARL
jgi:hypothetical protein